MQFARPPVIIQTIRRVRLLLRLDNHRARPQSMYGSPGNINHVARVNTFIQFSNVLGALLVDRLLPTAQPSRPAFSPKATLRSRLRVSHIPALGFAPGLTHAARLLIIGMNLH